MLVPKKVYEEQVRDLRVQGDLGCRDAATLKCCQDQWTDGGAVDTHALPPFSHSCQYNHRFHSVERDNEEVEPCDATGGK